MSRRSAARRRLTTTAATRRSLRMAIAGLRNRAPTRRHRATIRLRGRTPRPAAAIPLLRAPIPRRAPATVVVAMAVIVAAEAALAVVVPAAVATAAAGDTTAAVAVEAEVAAAVAAVAEAPAEAGVPSLTAAGTKFHHWHARKPARNFRWAFLFSGAMLPVTQRWFSASWLHRTLPVGGC